MSTILILVIVNFVCAAVSAGASFWTFRQWRNLRAAPLLVASFINFVITVFNVTLLLINLSRL